MTKDCSHRNGAIDWDSGAWHCHDCGADIFDNADVSAP